MKARYVEVGCTVTIHGKQYPVKKVEYVGKGNVKIITDGGTIHATMGQEIDAE